MIDPGNPVLQRFLAEYCPRELVVPWDDPETDRFIIECRRAQEQFRQNVQLNAPFRIRREDILALNLALSEGYTLFDFFDPQTQLPPGFS